MSLEPVSQTEQSAQPPAAERTQALEAQVAKLTRDLETSKRRREIDRVLIEHNTIDIDAAAVITELALQQSESPDLRRTVQALTRSKPYLFKGPRPVPASGAMAPNSTTHTPPAPQPSDRLARLAEQARTTGDRRQLIDYLRARRTTT